MKQKKLLVDGMHCAACETLVVDEVGGIRNVKGATADHEKGVVEVKYEGGVDFNEVKKAIEDLGYRVKADEE